MTQSRTTLHPTIRVSSRVETPSDAVLDAAADASDDVRVVETGPIGHTKLDPLVLATLDGQTAYLPSCDPADAAAAAEALAEGSLPDAAYIVAHDPGTATLPVPDDSPLSVGVRRTLDAAGWVDPTDPADYDRLVADDVDGIDLHDRVRQAGLLGRGRGDGSTDELIADAWDTTMSAEGDPVVVVNGHEADDRIEGDHLLLSSIPIAVLDAAAAVADAVNATDVIVYLDEGDERLYERVRTAVVELDPDVPTQVVTGPDRYIAGEMTMALEAMEGNDRLEARRRPPSPAEHGLHGRPTVIHTPRTIAQIRRAIVSPDEFIDQPKREALAVADGGAAVTDPGTRLVTVSSDVDGPATVELPTTSSLDTVTDAVSTAAEDGDYAFACVGGQFGGFTDDLEVPASASALDAADLGTSGAVELFDESQCVVATAGTRAGFAKDENCGRCVPCREGSKQLVSLLRDVYSGDFDAAKIRELARVVRGSSTCGFGKDAGRTVATAVDRFETEFRAHADGRCPSGACDSL